MNRKLGIGLALQIPNLLLAVAYLTYLLLPYLTVPNIIIVVGGVFIILINVFSVIYIAQGIWGKR